MKRYILLVLTIISLVFSSNAVKAETPKSDQKITIVPFMQQVDIYPESGDHFLQFIITNRSSEPRNFRFNVVDFGSLDDSGGLIFGGNNFDKLTTKYGLANWLKPEVESAEVPAGQNYTVNVQVNDNSSLQPGGHYAALIASPINTPSTSATINVDQKISSLVFLTKHGGEKYDMSLTTTKINGTIFSLPTRADFTFRNNGNVHIIPRGSVDVKDGDIMLAKGIINEESRYLFPEHSRRFSTDIKILKRPLFFGRIKIAVTYHYDGYEKLAVKTYSRLYLNPLSIGFFVVIITILTAAEKRKKYLQKTFKKCRNNISKVLVKKS